MIVQSPVHYDLRRDDSTHPGTIIYLIPLLASGRKRVCRSLTGAAVGLLFFAAQTLWGQTTNELLLPARILTNINEIWEIPRQERTIPHRIQTEVVIYYFDSEWDTVWGECGGKPGWLSIRGSPTMFKAGQRVAIDGVIIPVQERFIWSKTQTRVLEENVDVKVEPVVNLRNNPNALNAHLISVEGLIDRQLEDPTHFTLDFLVGDTMATVYVLKDTSITSPAFKEGNFVRIKCVYAPQYGKDGGLSGVNLWVAGPNDIQILGSLSTDARFTLSATRSEEIQEDTPTNNLLRVEGIVRSHEQGKWVTIWDGTGQVTVQSKQTQPLRFGDHIEAIGYPFVLGVQQSLHSALYRFTSSTNSALSTQASGAEKSPLRLAEQVRDLSREEADSHPVVNLRALVTWSWNRAPFAYIQDASGGVRVGRPRWEPEDAWKPGTIVNVRGTVTMGAFVPVITNAVLSRIGYWNLDEPRSVTLEQALTGAEDGRWVEMHGFVREVSLVRGMTRLDLSTPGGEFQVLVSGSQPFDAMKGSIIKVQGVCAAISNARHQLTGIQVWTPDSKYVQVVEPAPDDLFAGPFRPLANLRRFNMESALNRRVRTSGTVVLHVPGRYLYVQDGADSVFALSQQQDALQPGDRVEVVGFPGNEGRRFLLREAVYRRVSAGEEPTPVKLSAMSSVDVDLAGLLARAEGTLLNKVENAGETRLLIHSDNSAFEVSLDLMETNDVEKLKKLELGSRLAVTGVYEVQSDEYGNPRSFLFHLRSWKDIQLLQRPPWWTFARLLWVLLGLLLVSAVVLVWSFLISRKNKLLQQAQGELQIANDQLELRVEERTRELREQVVAKERAHVDLAQAQQSLMLASRQAGMAEVATGVLHNVGNVLNSVNVSAALIGERLRNCRVESVTKTAALLHEQRADLASFLTENPRGKAVPDYLEKLGKSLSQDKHDMQGEVELLTKNIDHIKIIVAMQQNHAKAGGVLEELDPKDLAEDAIQINLIALDRHGIQLARDYEPVPHVLVDRHKVLQILINLVNNAKHALDVKPSNRELVLRVSAAGSDRVSISVRDNGMGIAPENLNSIFLQGFTTRKDGHGFGLHSGANAARELGGSLSVHSEGAGLGATFTLELPTINLTQAKPAPAAGKSAAS